LNLLEPSTAYKPFKYEWAVAAAKEHEAVHWTEEDIDLSQDVSDWNDGTITPIEKNHITQILKLFTQLDIEVGRNYIDHFLPNFKNNEIRMMISSFIARECFDSHTEILTSNGWVLFPYIASNMRFAQYNQDSSEISFTEAIKLIKSRYIGKMHHYSGRTLDILCTPNHNLLTINPHTRKMKKNKSSGGIWSRNFLCPVSQKLKDYTSESDELQKLKDSILIMIQADGNIKSQAPWCLINRPNEKRCYVFLTKQHKIDRARELLISCGESITWNETTKRDGVSFSILVDWEDQTKLKSLDWVDLESFSRSRLLNIVEECGYWDAGHTSGCSDGSFYYYNTNKNAIDKLSAILPLIGYRGVLGINKTARKDIQVSNNKQRTKQTKTCYYLSLTKNTETVYPDREEVYYDGYTYCVEVPDHNIVIRRNGRVAIVGNCIHQRSYALLNDTLGLPESEYHAFLEYKEMADKIDFMQENNTDTKPGIARAVAKMCINEGVGLFGAFIMLLNYRRCKPREDGSLSRGKMPGMCTVVEYSIIDEMIHYEHNTKLFREFCDENPEVKTDELKASIYQMARDAVAAEDKFIDLAYEMGETEGLTKDELKQYIRYIADRRLVGLGLKPNFEVLTNPLPWVDILVNGNKHANFFESRVTDYRKGGLEGQWADAW
jgi:ribonucleotide reductase beta subunit family protein with ferritin-like domain